MAKTYTSTKPRMARSVRRIVASGNAIVINIVQPTRTGLPRKLKAKVKK
jgi:hypothetical protein